MLLLSVAVSSAAFGQSFIDDLKSFHSSAYFARRVGLESEFTGLSQERVAEIIRQSLGGEITSAQVDYDYVEKGVSHRYLTLEYTNTGTYIGDVLVKPEDNSPTLDALTKVATPNVVEVVSRPLSVAEVRAFGLSQSHLKVAGARGTTDESAVAFQVNAEMGKSFDEIDTEHVLAVMRNYLRPENRREIANHLNVPEIRQQYVGYPTPGFMRRLFNPGYHPTKWRLYIDSMYRASLEHIGDAQAWSYTDDQARAALRTYIEKNDFQDVLKVLKWNYVRYSSLMMFMFPDEWLSKYLLSTDWFKPYPILEFREPNNDFQTTHTVTWILGLIAASREIGDFTPATLRAKVCERALAASF